MDPLSTVFGVIAGILTSVRLLPQVVKSVTTKQTRDLSLWFLVILFFQALFLILYGITKPDALVAWMNVIPLLCSVVLLYLKRRYR